MTNQLLEKQIAEINKLKKERNAIILAHNYQMSEVQELADFVGDSLALSQEATKIQADTIVFCGVHFMAESACILAPDKTVLLPAANAGCPMADMAQPHQVLEWREKYPKAAIVAYVNSSAAVKALSDYCCTSANAVTLAKNIPEKEIIFLPDQNLAQFVATQIPEKKFHFWPGYCVTHNQITPEEVLAAKQKYPHAKVLIHPECRRKVTELANFVGSTSQIISYVRESSDEEFIVGTEMGIIHALSLENPNKKFRLLSPALVCPNMKQTTIPKILDALKTMSPVITVDPDTRGKAALALDRMLQYV